MRSRPIFIPYEGEHLAAVITLPDHQVRGVAIFPLRTPQLGLPANVFWAQAATGLAAHSVASIRFEHAGSGDSTGILAGGVAAIAEPVQETIAVGRFAMEALGLESFTAAGNCYGGAVVLEAARDPRCAAVVSISTSLAEPGRLGRIRRSAARSRFVHAVRSRPRLRRLLRYDRIRRWLRDGMSGKAHAALERTGRHARVLLIDDQQLDTRGLVRGSDRYRVCRDISFGTIRVDAVELDPGEQRVLETLVDWIVEATAGDRSVEPLKATPAGSRRRDRAVLGG